MNQNTYGNFLGYQEWPGMTFDPTRLYKTWIQEFEFLKISGIMFEMWLCSTTCVVIQDLGWTQLESTSKIIIINVENSSFGYDGTIGNFVKMGLCHTCGRTPWILKLAPWKRMLRTTFSLAICLMLRSTKPNCSTTIPVPPPLFSPLGQPKPKQGGECFAPCDA